MDRVSADDGGDRRAPHRSRSDQPEPGLVFGRAVEPHRLYGAAAIAGRGKRRLIIPNVRQGAKWTTWRPCRLMSFGARQLKWLSPRRSRIVGSDSTFHPPRA